MVTPHDGALNMNAADANAKRPREQPVPVSKWKFRDIEWKWVLKNQNWACFVLTIICALVPFVIIWQSGAPHSRLYVLYDASIGYPLKDDTIPAWVAVLLPWAMFLATMVVCEFVIMRSKHGHISNALSTALHFFLDGVCAFVTNLLLTEIFKHVVGRLRPNFLAQCDPIVPPGYPFGTDYAPRGPTEIVCRNSNKDVEDARKSFPSGHASFAALFCFYNAGYLLWTIYSRQHHSVFGFHKNTRRPFWSSFIRDVGHTLALWWIIFQVGFAWAVSATRVIDYKHNVSDVLGGLLLGMTIGLIFVMRAIPTIRFLEHRPAGTGSSVAGDGDEGDLIPPNGRNHTSPDDPVLPV